MIKLGKIDKKRAEEILFIGPVSAANHRQMACRPFCMKRMPGKEIGCHGPQAANRRDEGNMVHSARGNRQVRKPADSRVKHARDDCDTGRSLEKR